jgi:hypothetical protein
MIRRIVVDRSITETSEYQQVFYVTVPDLMSNETIEELIEKMVENNDLDLGNGWPNTDDDNIQVSVYETDVLESDFIIDEPVQSDDDTFLSAVTTEQLKAELERRESKQKSNKSDEVLVI